MILFPILNGSCLHNRKFPQHLPCARYSGEDGGEESVSVFAVRTVLLLESNCAWPSNKLIQQFSSRAESALDMYVAMCG